MRRRGIGVLKRKLGEGPRRPLLFSLLFLLFFLPWLHAYLHPLESPHLQAICKVYGYHFQANPSSPSHDSLVSSPRDCGAAPTVVSSLPSSLFFFHPLSRSPPL